MKNFLERFGPWAIVTGASSGIGEAFARRLAELGMNLVLVARREDRLRTLAGELERQHNIKTRVAAADLSRDDFLPAVEQATADLEIRLLVNNAGFAVSGRFLDNDLTSEIAQLHVNNRAPLILAHHFGRLMRTRHQGGMIFLASILSFAGVPGMSNYAATKAHDLVFAEGLARELGHDGISVLALCPGGTRTDLWPAGVESSSLMSPAAVVDVAVRKLGRKTTVVAGWKNRVITLATRLQPRSWNAAIYGSVVGGMLKKAQPSQQSPQEHPHTHSREASR